MKYIEYFYKELCSLIEEESSLKCALQEVQTSILEKKSLLINEIKNNFGNSLVYNKDLNQNISGNCLIIPKFNHQCFAITRDLFKEIYQIINMLAITEVQEFSYKIDFSDEEFKKQCIFLEEEKDFLPFQESHVFVKNPVSDFSFYSKDDLEYYIDECALPNEIILLKK